VKRGRKANLPNACGRALAEPVAGTVAFGTSEGPAEDVAVQSEDAATILFRFAGGARGSAVISQVSPGRKNAFNLEVAGSHVTLDWDQEDPERLWIRTREEARQLMRRPEDGPGSIPGIPSLPAGHPEGWAEALRDLLDRSTRPCQPGSFLRTTPSRAIRRSTTGHVAWRSSRPCCCLRRPGGCR
jgi:predicted dehydrogenase